MSSYDILIEKGIEKKEIEVIKNLRLEGSTLEFISKIVKLPVKRIRQILDELGIE
jgi:DNA-directed RNA polymerase sigma subunit (sigma70/sigma32)